MTSMDEFADWVIHNMGQIIDFKRHPKYASAACFTERLKNLCQKVLRKLQEVLRKISTTRCSTE